MVKNQFIAAGFLFFLFMMAANSYAQVQEQIAKSERDINVDMLQKYKSIKLSIIHLEEKIDKIEDSLDVNEKDFKNATLMVGEFEKRIADDTIEVEIKDQLIRERKKYREKTISLGTKLNLLDIQVSRKREELKETLKEKDDLESKHPFLLEERPVLQSIEVINIQGGAYRLDLAPGEKVKLRAIPHGYDKEGNDIGDKIVDFNPRWSAKYGIFTSETGTEVTYVLTYNIGRIAQFFIYVSQENVEGEIIKTDVWVNVMRNKKIEN